MPPKTVSEQIRSDPGLIPSLPEVIAEALRLVDEPEVTPDHFEKLLSRDQGLVANMLRLANSPVYGFAHRRESVREAVIGLGLKGLHGMLMAATLKRFFGPQFVCYGKDEKTLWRHAIAVGAGARFLTTQLPTSPDHPEEMFVAGLLHDLGKLLLAPFLTRMGQDMTACTEPLHFVEDRLAGISHQEAGGVVAERWNLKPMIRAVITCHHFQSCPEEHRHAVTVVRLVDQCATSNGFGAGRLEPDTKFLAADLDVIGLEPDDWHDLALDLLDEMRAAVRAN